ncbi:MAG TPA: hypothetical protein VLF39_03760 [Candidatus Saccharimonadales bacterium]|nr:hypothetical protein [Candidatus Saccharimonadales bacterium]
MDETIDNSHVYDPKADLFDDIEVPTDEPWFITEASIRKDSENDQVPYDLRLRSFYLGVAVTTGEISLDEFLLLEDELVRDTHEYGRAKLRSPESSGQ